VAHRLALPADAPVDAVRATALEELATWRRLAEDPFASRPAVRVYRAVARTCEGVVASLITTVRPSRAMT
jgi:hypothetical protein